MTASKVYLSTSFVWGILFWMMSTVFMVYQVDVIHLDALQLVLVGTALEVSAFVFEVPTGVVADRYSRKLSVVIGYLITGVAFLVMGLVPTFGALVVASLLWGLGWTFMSGAHQAWLADEIGEAEAAGIYLKAARLRNYGSFIGIVLAVIIGQVDVALPIVVSGLLFMVWALVLLRLMQEEGFEPRSASEGDGMLQMLHEGVAIIRRSRTLLLLVLVGVVFGTFSEGFDRLSTAHLLRAFPVTEATGLDAVSLFGLLAAISVLLSIGAVRLAEDHVDTDSARALSIALSIATGLIIVGVVAFALAGHVWLALLTFILLAPIRSVIDPLTMAWFNRNIPSASRATVISMHAQADALGQMAGGPAVGLIGRELSVRVALSVAGVLLSPALWLYRRAREVPID